MTNGFVSLVGAGPGDPDLLTVKALKRIQDADVVVFDRLVSAEIMARVPHGVGRISVGKTPGYHCVPQNEINEILVNLAKSGRRVVRLKGGDPYLFGRGGEEALILRQHSIPFDVVPGITAATGCSAYSGIPLTHRGLNHGVRFITGRLHNEDGPDINWEKVADPDCTLVIYMGLSNLSEIAKNLIQAGLRNTTPAAAIHAGSTLKQQIVISTLATLNEVVEEAELESPVIIIVGEVVNLSEKLDWYQYECARLTQNVDDETFDIIRA